MDKNVIENVKLLRPMLKDSFRNKKYSINDQGSVSLTDGFRVIVNPNPIKPSQIGADSKYLFEYNITIINEGEEWAKLISRKWLIIDAEGNEEVVEGPGVVGYSPELKPGDTFSYSSYCPLDSPWGTMEGHFTMVKQSGEYFDIKIDRFYLVSREVAEEFA